jgi:hypothetical protein
VVAGLVCKDEIDTALRTPRSGHDIWTLSFGERVPGHAVIGLDGMGCGGAGT